MFVCLSDWMYDDSHTTERVQATCMICVGQNKEAASHRKIIERGMLLLKSGEREKEGEKAE